MDNYLRYKNILAAQSFPYAFVDMEAFKKNVQINAERAKDKKIRIASKSVRCPDLMRLILDTNTTYQGLMAFHGKEAVFLSQQNFDDILLGYPIVDKAILQEIGKEIQKGKYICLMVDLPEHLAIANEVGKAMNVIFPICIDIDLSNDFGPLHFGVWRSQVTDEKTLNSLLQQIKKNDFLRLDGLMGYEAQIAGVADAIKGDPKNHIIRFLKKRSIPKVKSWRTKAIEMIRQEGFTLKFINGGGTGSIESTLQEKDVTEITVGSGLFQSHYFDNYTSFDLHPAIFFGIQIVRHPKPDIYTCHGGGYIASGAVDALKAPQVYLPEGAKLDKNEGAGEVQTPIHYKGKHSLGIGDPVFLRHTKAGEVCERFRELLLIEDDTITGTALTYRGFGGCFL